MRMARRIIIIVVKFIMFCDHLKGIMTEFRGQRMLQLVVIEDRNILKVIEVTFCTDFSDKSPI